MNIYFAPYEDRNGSIAVRSLLENAFMAEYREILPKIEKTPSGKPYFPDKPDIHFSLSHSKTHVLCVLADVPVGADTESPRRITERAVRYFCSREELREFDALDLWVLKESYIKLVGGTLVLMKSLRFSRTDGVISAPDRGVESKLYRIGDCRVAVSALGEIPPDNISRY